MDCLLSQSTADLENVCAHASPGPANTDATVWGPVIDGVQLMGMPAQLAQDGKIASPVPTLLGSNHDEGSMFTPCQHSGANACTETLVRVARPPTTSAARTHCVVAWPTGEGAAGHQV